jgi:predicted patatin/cPLA2 family phospholipase
VKTGLVLEGGACKGIFTAGVLDYWMHKEVIFPYVVGVSAGACNALDYLSNQEERTKNCMLPENKQDRYYGMNRLLKTGHIFDLNRVFEEYPYKQFPFDAETYFKSSMINENVVTNCSTGEAEYLLEKEDVKKLFLIGKASSSIPLLAEMVKIDDDYYLDGGLADSIPIERAFKQGCNKIVVILTHNKGYIPSIPKKAHILYNRKYKNFNNLLKTIYNRPNMYKKEMKLLDRYKAEGKAFVISPSQKAVGRLETNAEKMEDYYRHGYQQSRDSYKKLLEFINGNK